MHILPGIVGKARLQLATLSTPQLALAGQQPVTENWTQSANADGIPEGVVLPNQHLLNIFRTTKQENGTSQHANAHAIASFT